MLPLLQRTSSILHASARKYASYAPLPTSASASLPIKDLELPKPESLAAQLLTLGIDENASHRICSTFDRLSEELKSRLEVDYKRRCRSLQPRAHYFHDDKSVSMLSLTYLTWHKKALQTWSSYILENFVPRLIHAKSKLHTVLDNRESGYATKPKRAFNQRAVPILEQFFEGNAFPSRLEKIELADRCNMEYRQIHVWFQNRRSRFRKEGRSFKKRELGAGFVEVFENAVVDELFLCGSVEESSARDSSSEVSDVPLSKAKRSALIF
ncbi:hypothetical protein C8Q78DRAFT_615894 [Trametes maxima]|nr:hypothetical protein C8Q78DRAFT_615894 [Trametes maxima]